MMVSTLKKYSGVIIGLLFAMLVSNILSLTLPLGLKLIIDEASNPSFEIILPWICFGLFGAIVIRTFLQWLVRHKASVITEQITCNLSRRIYAHALRLPLLEVIQKKPINIINHITVDIQQIKLFGLSEAIDGLYSFMTILIALLILAWMHPILMVIALSALVISSLLLIRIVPSLKKGYIQYKDEYQNVIARSQEVLTGISIVKIFNMTSDEESQFSRNIQKSSRFYLNNQNMNQTTIGLVELFLGLALTLMLLMGALHMQDWHLTTGTIAAFYTYIFMMFSPLLRLGGLSGSFQQAQLSWGRIEKFLQASEKCESISLKSDSKDLMGVMQVHELSFNYPQTSMILDKISFSVIPGETLGIVGPSGAGKTTLVHLLTGLLSPVEGIVRIDGLELKNIDKDLLARSIGVVFQDNHLFSASIIDNICYGAVNVSEQQVYAAARASKAADFIEELPDKYQTLLTERGLNLSGGQRQRIALARALIRNPKILIMDEATCALDALTENEVQKSIRQFCPDAAIITVAHRFSTIMDADHILVIQEGRMIEQGNHNYLLSQKGLYSTLYFEQFKPL